jgi:hypothetical protein
VPVRDPAAVLAVTLKLTVPLPVRLGRPDTVIQLALLTTFQLHALLLTVTVVVNVVAADDVECDVGDRVNTQELAWLTVSVWLPISSVPVRAVVAELAATV